MIEAMACGTPVVALRRGSVPEVALDGTTGYIRDDPADLPAAIDQAGSIDPAALTPADPSSADDGPPPSRWSADT
jgi:glycosyltransferase involved in cell wall biosynthesis